MFKCFVVAPYKGFRDLVLSVADSYPFQIEVGMGSLEEGLALAKEAERQGFDVIVGRGGTARLIEENCQVPVVEVKVTSYDILRVLTLLKGYQGKIGIIGSSNMVHDVALIAELLEIEVIQLIIRNEQEVETALKEATRAGLNLLIADVAAGSLAEKKGFTAVLITSGKEAITVALDEVRQMIQFHEYRQKEIEQKILPRPSHPVEMDQPTLGQLLRTMEITSEVYEGAQKYSRLREPILLCGEYGTGKRRLAKAIHQGSPFSDGPFVVLDPQSDPQTVNFDALFDPKHGLLSLAHRGTLFIQSVESLPMPVQGQLYKLLLTPQLDFQCVFASSIDLREAMENGKLHPDLFFLLWQTHLDLPPLRERLDELEDMIRLYIAEMNESMGTEVAAVKPDVFEALRSYTWPGNITELKAIIRLLVQNCSTMFITMESAQPVLDQHLARNAQKLQLSQWIGKKTLEEMEMEIIDTVIEEEDNNQSRAAKRLGIDRSTLWRKRNTPKRMEVDIVAKGAEDEP
ncbi:sigma-54-dependent Fis family transcriptional regulator [Ammoniphilus resinae]|uniref:DNA-binding NtrC family response regulator n=1 Tax=Ammoniphilus resinae TaxID=861532 RepID=A0ABS4GWF2_9BACL|nr:sigma-54-dependent transcriptional regulator [Ammoniphilus resinae]MBP1934357.1 DNA-binding NtrC family response regulator [Ammoniphilus resinae]